MNGKSLSLIIAVAMLVGFSNANATEPVLLTNVELGTVTAGSAIVATDHHIAKHEAMVGDHWRLGMPIDHHSMQKYPIKEQKHLENSRLFCDGAKGTNTQTPVPKIAISGSSPKIDVSSLGYVRGR